MSHTIQVCPICKTSVQPFERYPRYLFLECSSRARSKDGPSLKFSNIDMTGGFMAVYTDTGESHASHECYVDGILCHADEHRFSGIVIQPVQES
ncbi:MAG TPA: hypothetical protein VN653_17900 [Anaerolineales bacterium]|nr:hypothetical protein [Anaerolineales bacterium]